MSSAATGHRLFAARPSSGALVDVGIALAAFVVSMALLARHGIGSPRHGPDDLDLLGGLLVAFATLPLVGWRRAPRGVFVLTASVTVLQGGLGYSIGLALGPTAALYLLAATRAEHDPWTPRDTAIVVALFLGYLGATGLGDGRFPGSELLHTGLAWAVAWLAGERTRLLHEHVAELRERALRAGRDAERERRLAVAEERARIARDLHDSAGHAINVIAVRAGAGRMRHDEEPERSRAALEEIEEVARRTVGEIDQIVGSLRDPDSENGAAPAGLASIGTLASQHSAAGLEVAVATEGAPRPLGPALDRAAYRILQEGLTNAARYGTGEAQIELAFGETALDMTITNPVLDRGGPRSNGGHGVIGMRERATLLGGTLEAGRVGGSFRLRARLPYDAQRA